MALPPEAVPQRGVIVGEGGSDWPTPSATFYVFDYDNHSVAIAQSVLTGTRPGHTEMRMESKVTVRLRDDDMDRILKLTSTVWDSAKRESEDHSCPDGDETTILLDYREAIQQNLSCGVAADWKLVEDFISVATGKCLSHGNIGDCQMWNRCPTTIHVAATDADAAGRDVEIGILLEIDGSVSQRRVQRSSGKPSVDALALDAVSECYPRFNLGVSIPKPVWLSYFLRVEAVTV